MELSPDKKILILGAQKEGLSTLEFLRRRFPQQIIYLADQQPLTSLPLSTQKTIATDKNLITHFGPDYLDFIKTDKIEIIFKAPGIPLTLAPLQQALQNGIQITSQTQLFFELCPCPIIGITGTKGKSTTSSLIYHVLKENNQKAFLAGNIGVPVLSQLPDLTADNIAVLELSSHQLADLKSSPHYAVVQDIQPEHLDYYPDFKSYVAAKANIALHQNENDFIIYNPEFKQPRRIAEQSAAKQLTFSLTHKTGNCLYFHNQQAFYFDLKKPRPHHLEPEIVNLKKIHLTGKHNLLNLAPAIIIGFKFGLTARQIEAALNSFTPLKHRLEFVSQIKGVDYYNDSMATMPDATQAALANFKKKPVILIAGGSEKNANYHHLATQILDQNIPQLILFSPTGDRIIAALKDLVSEEAVLPKIKHVVTMTDAVEKAASAAKPGSIVLLSPASASFGLFQNAYDRGEQFIAAVQNLVK